MVIENASSPYQIIIYISSSSQIWLVWQLLLLLYKRMNLCPNSVNRLLWRCDIMISVWTRVDNAGEGGEVCFIGQFMKIPVLMALAF